MKFLDENFVKYTFLKIYNKMNIKLSEKPTTTHE